MSFSPERRRACVNVMPGDDIVCEIDGLGRLANTIVADAAFARC